MKLEFNFSIDSWDELVEEIKKHKDVLRDILFPELTDSTKPVLDAKPEPKAKAKEETAAPDPAPVAPDPEPDNSISLEDLQSEAKNALAEANTKSGKRLSTEWCNELAGKGMKVKDIKDPEILTELIRRAKEVTG